MMRDLSMHVMDIVQNSIKAGAGKIDIELYEDDGGDLLFFSVNDNGCGMSREMVEKVRSPFTTSRTERRVGLGLPMLDTTCGFCDGKLAIESEVGKGTYIKAEMRKSHIDRPPLGDINGTIFLLIISNVDIRFTYKRTNNGKEFLLDTDEINAVLDGVPINSLEIMDWLKGFIDSSAE